MQSLTDTLSRATNDRERQDAAWALGMLGTTTAVQALIDQGHLPLAMVACQSSGLAIDFRGGEAYAVELAELHGDVFG